MKLFKRTKGAQPDAQQEQTSIAMAQPAVANPKEIADLVAALDPSPDTTTTTSAAPAATTVEVPEASPAPTAETPEAKAEREKAEKEAQKAAKKAEREKIAAEKKAKREEEAAKKKAEREAKKAEREAAKAAKPKTIHFGSDKVGRIKHTLGEQLGDYMVLTMQDAMLTGDDLVAKQNETLETIGKMGSKVKNRAVFLFDFVSGKKKELNEVLERTLRVLARDGKLVSGDKGNLHADLIAKPYAPSAARAMGNNTLNLFRTLKLIQAGTEKQTFVANPDSLLLAKANSLLGL